MILKSSPKIFNEYKCDNPENTIARIEEGFKKLGLDISYREQVLTSNDLSIYTGLASIEVLGWSQCGKGTSKLLAKASAYAEMAERFSAGFILMKIPLPREPSKFQKLMTTLVDRSFLNGFEKVKNHKSVTYKNVLKYFNEEISKTTYDILKNEHLLDAVADAYSLNKNQYEKLPINLIEILSMSNGLASGNTLEEAITQASCEIFERHAVYEILSKKIICPTIELESIKNAKIQGYIKLLKNLNIDIEMKDFSLNSKIPVVGILFTNHNLDDSKNRLLRNIHYKRIDAGSHLDINEAIIRTLTEYVDLISSGIKDIEKLQTLYESWIDLGNKYVGPDNDFKYLTREYDYYGDLTFLEKGKKISIDDLKSSKNNDCYDDVKEIIEICKKNNWDIFAVDFTNKVLKFPTVRVIIPPISTDFDVFRRKIFNIKNFDERINYFYGIKNFYKYVSQDKWIKDKKQISLLINNIENFLSKELNHYVFPMSREGIFFQWVNLIHILPFLYLSINDLENAKKYFQLNIKISTQPPTESPFFRFLYSTKYSEKNYKRYINYIDKKVINNKNNFELKSNPFDMEPCNEEQEQIYFKIFRKIGESFY